MTRKEKNTVVPTDRNGDERIIKRSGLKITIITVLVLILLTLIGVGIYFIVESTKKENYKDLDWEVVKAEEAQEKILNSSAEDEFGLYFYEEGGVISNFLLRNNESYEDGEDATGALAEVVNSTSEDITWLAIEIPEDNNELIEELLTVPSTKPNEEGYKEYIFAEEFEYLGSGSSLRDGTWIIDSLTGEDEQDGFEPDDKIVESFSLQVQDNGDEDEDNLRDVMFLDSSTGGGTDSGDGSETTETESIEISTHDGATGTAYSVSDGTTMLFNGTQLTSVVDSWGTTTVTEDYTEDESDKTRDEWHDSYVDWLEFLIDHNTNIYS